MYKVPFDFTHEEKVFGGYLSLRQMIYVVMSIISLGIFFIPKIPVTLKLVFYTIIFASCMSFAFWRIGNKYADKYFVDIIKFIFRKKKYM